MKKVLYPLGLANSQRDQDHFGLKEFLGCIMQGLMNFSCVGQKQQQVCIVIYAAKACKSIEYSLCQI